MEANFAIRPWIRDRYCVCGMRVSGYRDDMKTSVMFFFAFSELNQILNVYAFCPLDQRSCLAIIVIVNL